MFPLKAVHGYDVQLEECALYVNGTYTVPLLKAQGYISWRRTMHWN